MKYVLAYEGGQMAETPEAQQAVMAQWGRWFGELGAALVDGGAPFGQSKTVGSSNGSASHLTGYSIIDAATLEAASAMAKGCPVLSGGGKVTVYETIAM